MKRIYEIDKDGIMTYDFLEVDENYEAPSNYVETPLPTDEHGHQLPFWRPKWTGEEWVESKSKEEIEEIMNRPIPLTPVEILQLENSELLFQNAMQDMAILVVQEENANLLLQGALQEMTLSTIQEETADLMFKVAIIEMGAM